MTSADRDAEIIVVGTGAGGATVARALAQAERDVLMIEEGPDLRKRPGEPSALDSMLRRFRKFGAQVAEGPATIPLIQGCCVGGSTAINSAIFWKLPEAVHAEWVRADPGLEHAMPYREIDKASEAIERAIHVRPVQLDVMGMNNLLLQRATRALGIEGHPIRRAESGCEGKARCILGCPGQRRNSMETTFIPHAIDHGAALLPNTRVEKVRLSGGRAIGVEIRSGRQRGFISARRAIILAAGAIHTPWILQCSGLRNGIGQQFTAHPGFSVCGMFDEPVRMDEGASQGFESTHLAPLGMKVEALGLPRALAAARLPSAGEVFRKLAERMDHLAIWGCLIRPKRHGRISRSLFGGPRIQIPLGSEDLERIVIGIKHLSELMFAAGAHSVFPGVFGLPPVIESHEQIHQFARLRADQVSLVATHLFGGAILGTDPRRSVVDPSFEVHEVKGLFVADASIIPTSLGVNPQGTIMALALIAAERIAARLSRNAMS